MPPREIRISSKHNLRASRNSPAPTCPDSGAPALAGEQGEAKFVVVQQRFTIKAQRRHHGKISLGQFAGKCVFFANGRIAQTWQLKTSVSAKTRVRACFAA